jgi:H+-translocating NAD(P) transhydrogenase subunit alpha
MIIGVLKETYPNELRVALIPSHAETLIKKGFTVLLASNAGLLSGYLDEDYKQKGVTIVPTNEAVLKKANIHCAVRTGANLDLKDQLLTQFTNDQLVIGLLEPYRPHPVFEVMNQLNMSSFSLELLPRSTRAQSMDVLSSMANLAGYKSVILAAMYAKKMFPMMMTAAGTIVPAKVLILGVGVAGLQAIATAKRLGAVVSAYDVRKEVKEQVESLGAKFVELAIESASGEGGYAKAMDAAYYQRQQALLLDVIKDMDVIITTANIPGKKAPILVTKAMVEAMASGSVIIDLAAERGGNCELTEIGKILDHKGVTIVGVENVPSQLAFNASALYSKNMVNFLDILFKKTEGGMAIQWDDDIVKATLVNHKGSIVHPQAKQWLQSGGPTT